MPALRRRRLRGVLDVVKAQHQMRRLGGLAEALQLTIAHGRARALDRDHGVEVARALAGVGEAADDQVHRTGGAGYFVGVRSPISAQSLPPLCKISSLNSTACVC